MKLAYPIATPEISEPFMGLHGDFRRNVHLVKEIGYEAVELCTCNPEEYDVNEVAAILAGSGIQVAAVATSHLINQDGLALQGVDEVCFSRAIERFRDVITLAARLKAPISIGKFRGNVSDPAAPENQERLVSSLRDLCAFAAESDVGIAIEPQHSTNINNINSIDEALCLLDKVQVSNLFLHLDTFHLNLTEIDASESIIRADDRIVFMHLSDSERKIPGEGEIDLAAHFKSLSGISYNGYLSFEIRQGNSPIETAREAFQKTMEIMRTA